MKYVIQFLIILGFSFAGEVLRAVLPLPIPASIYGIVLLFLALETKVVKVRHVQEVSGWLIAVMPLMFVPAAVGLIPAWGVVKSSLLQYVIVTVVSTFCVMAVAGWVTQIVIRWQNKKKMSQTKEEMEGNA